MKFWFNDCVRYLKVVGVFVIIVKGVILNIRCVVVGILKFIIKWIVVILGW